MLILGRVSKALLRWPQPFAMVGAYRTLDRFIFYEKYYDLYSR